MFLVSPIFALSLSLLTPGEAKAWARFLHPYWPGLFPSVDDRILIGGEALLVRANPWVLR